MLDRKGELDRRAMAGIALCCCLAVVWALVALLLSMVWDLDQSWYNRESVADPILLLQILAFWPVWGTVQAEDALAEVGWRIGGALPIVMFLVAVMPIAQVDVLQAGWTRR